MKIVTPFFINKFKDKIINIHPSLLPAYKGGSAIKDSILNGSKITGCSVHFVDEEVDSGSLIMQAALHILNNDNIETLSKKIQLLHTRKTIPLYRLPLSEACNAAGCAPHRYDLSSSILLKENHLKLASKPLDLITKAIKKDKIVVVEAKTLKFAKTVSNLKISRILLDNFTPAMIKSFISSNPKVKIEISGSVNLSNINKFAIKGVHYISVGDLTKNIESKDLSMLIV